MDTRSEKVIIFLLLLLLVMSVVKFIPQVSITAGFMERATTPVQNVSEKTEVKEFVPGKIGMLIPAVDENGEGVVVGLTVEVKEGEGRLLTNIENLLFFLDTQNSINVAKHLAENYTGIDTSDKDIIYSVDINRSGIIEGDSAGAAMAIATIAALEGNDLNSSVMITGAIDSNGRILQVGSVYEKALAASEAGAELFLVPKNQKVFRELRRVKTCEMIDGVEYCEIKYRYVTPESLGEMEIKEVATLEEALKYFGLVME
ncbi:MAG: hypothetical protein DRP11_03865 [Candidatus Aenigmatarchaeota archaeon]|nr:MAG: hypothetical protein DRP11_03865 [Candidatus Aenigmarchaeota archaeon]